MFPGIHHHPTIRELQGKFSFFSDDARLEGVPKPRVRVTFWRLGKARKELLAIAHNSLVPFLVFVCFQEFKAAFVLILVMVPGGDSVENVEAPI
jgi:hypothetical protein